MFDAAALDGTVAVAAAAAAGSVCFLLLIAQHKHVGEATVACVVCV